LVVELLECKSGCFACYLDVDAVLRRKIAGTNVTVWTCLKSAQPPVWARSFIYQLQADRKGQGCPLVAAYFWAKHPEMTDCFFGAIGRR
jgi:hypothetical protein